ncbi:MAG: biotin--[acetyl-CoA-carboxylase] ligase, partial [Prevotella sp.]|nr:biotin--[acetyl-CoA-carboxylase] ligase [Prevotella sp.]
MNIEEAREFCLSVKGASESFPFDEYVLVFKVMEKMFAYVSLNPKDGQFRISMKCDPERSIELRERYSGITKGDHTASDMWNAVYIESDVPDHLIKELIQHSVDEVIKKLPQKKKEEYRGIIHVKECGSTNNALSEINKKKPQEENTILWSDFQSAGKGQRGNKWESEKGKNLLFSILLYPEIKANEQFIISQVVSLAVAGCLLNYTEDITIKWPNDIYWKEKKICGILVGNVLEGDYIKQSIAGIGININQTLFVSDAPNPVSLKQITGEKYNIFEILDKVRVNILNYNLQLQSGNINSIQ